MQIGQFECEIVTAEEVVRFGRKSFRGGRKHDEHIPLVVDLYQSGRGVQQVQKRLRRKGIDVSDTWICKRLKEAGIETRGYRRGGHRVLQYNGRGIILRGSHAHEKVRAVLDEYVAGARTADLSERHDAPASTIEKWATRAGVSRTREEAAAIRVVAEGRISPIAAARIAEDGADERSITEIAEYLGVTTATVLDYLQKRGAQTRTQREGLLIHHHGSLVAYRDNVQEICRMYHVDGLTRSAIHRLTGHSYPTISNALESEFNPYADDPEQEPDQVGPMPWHCRIDQLVDEGTPFPEAAEAVLLAWTPDPRDANSSEDAALHEYRVINSRSAAA